MTMKSTGIVRKVDELGRVVIPKETRELLFINEGDSLEIFKDENEIILKKYAPGSTFCGNMKNLTPRNNNRSLAWSTIKITHQV